MAKAINILHPYPKPVEIRRCLLPIGLYCNAELQRAEIGATVEFWQDWRHEKAVLVYRRVVRVNSAEFTDWLRLLYGENMSVSRLFERWKTECVRESVGKDGFDKESALLIGICSVKEEQK